MREMGAWAEPRVPVFRAVGMREIGLLEVPPGRGKNGGEAVFPVPWIDRGLGGELSTREIGSGGGELSMREIGSSRDVLEALEGGDLSTREIGWAVPEPEEGELSRREIGERALPPVALLPVLRAVGGQPDIRGCADGTGPFNEGCGSGFDRARAEDVRKSDPVLSPLCHSGLSTPCFLWNSKPVV